MGLTRRDGTVLSTALVTGASSGIGAATAMRLARSGCQLVLIGRDHHRLGKVAERTGGQAIVADLADRTGQERVLEAAAEADLVVHSAGVGWAGALESMSPDQIEKLVTVNLTAALRLTSALLPAMRARRGHLAFVASIATVGVRDEAVYSATKAGLRSFAASVRHDGVGVTTVFPGAVRTPFFDGRDYTRTVPRMVEPETVAERLVSGIQRNQSEVFVPRWLTVPSRLAGLAPSLFHLLSHRLG